MNLAILTWVSWRTNRWLLEKIPKPISRNKTTISWMTINVLRKITEIYVWKNITIKAPRTKPWQGPPVVRRNVTITGLDPQWKTHTGRSLYLSWSAFRTLEISCASSVMYSPNSFMGVVNPRTLFGILEDSVIEQNQLTEIWRAMLALIRWSSAAFALHADCAGRYSPLGLPRKPWKPAWRYDLSAEVRIF